MSGSGGVVESNAVAVAYDDCGVCDIESVDGADKAQDIACLEGGFKFGNAALRNHPDVSVAQIRLALLEESVKGIGVGELTIG